MTNKIVEMFKSIGLYDPVDLGNEYMESLKQIYVETVSIDLYCPMCHDFSVFTKKPIYSPARGFSSNLVLDLSNRPIEFLCSRDQKTRIVFFLHIQDNKVTKIGQYPSYQDVSLNIPNKYSTLLGNYFTEYKSALILYSHGFCVGAYAHLRRIIEHLISDAVGHAVNDGRYSQDELASMRVSERVAALKDYLPSFFIKNVPLYGIISKGIHELLEDECREFFPVLQAAIEITLDEEIERRNKAEKAKQAQGAIGKIAGLLGSKNNP